MDFKWVKRRVLNSQFTANSFWVIAGSVISKSLNFIVILFIAKLLGPSLFAEYNVIQTTVGLFGTVSGLGLGMTATKLIAEWRSKDIKRTEEIIGTLYILSFLISGSVALIFFFLSDTVANNLLNNGSLTTLLQITSFIVIFDSLNGVQNGVLWGFESFKKMTLINVIVGVISAPLLMVGAYTYGLIGLSSMLLFTRMLSCFITRQYLRKILAEKELSIHYNIRMKKEQLGPILGIGMPSFLGGLSNVPVNWLSTVIFVNQPNGYPNLGVYNAVNQLKQLVLFLPDSAGKVSIPRLANVYGTGDILAFKRLIIRIFLLNLVCSLLPAIFIFFFSFLFKNFIGAEYIISNSLVLCVLATSILIALTNAIGYIFICSNLMWYDFVFRLFWGAALIGILLFYGRYNGSLGFAIATMGAFLFLLIIQSLFLVFKLDLKPKPEALTQIKIK